MRRLNLILAGIICLTPLRLRAESHVDLTRIATPTLSGEVSPYPKCAIPAATQPERWDRPSAQLDPATRMDGRFVHNVPQPTIIPVMLAAGRSNRAAVVVAPGGAFLSFSMDGEGYDVARPLADHGIAALILKYRTNPVPDEEPAFMQPVGPMMGRAASPGGDQSFTDVNATTDALEALRLIRARAAEWRVDPACNGMIGLIAGAMTTGQALIGAPADHPAFAGNVYGPMSAIAVLKDAPPIFAAIAMDDGLLAKQGFKIVESWRTAGRPLELHAYERGDHGFGAGRHGTTTTLLILEFEALLEARSLLSLRAAQ